MKKSYFIISMIAFGLFSCKKERIANFEAGEKKGMDIYCFNSEIQGEIGKPEETIIDLDDDGKGDLRFRSEMDSISEFPKITAWSVFLDILSDQVEVAEMPGSGDRYQYTVPIFMSGSPFAEPNDSLVNTCKFISSAEVDETSNYPFFFTQGEELNFSDYNWDQRSDEKKIALESYDYRTAYFNAENEVVWRTNYFDHSCNSIEGGLESHYLIFRKEVEKDCYRVGWIEFYLGAENFVKIQRSALSKRTFTF